MVSVFIGGTCSTRRSCDIVTSRILRYMFYLRSDGISTCRISLRVIAARTGSSAVCPTAVNYPVKLVIRILDEVTSFKGTLEQIMTCWCYKYNVLIEFIVLM